MKGDHISKYFGWIKKTFWTKNKDGIINLQKTLVIPHKIYFIVQHLYLQKFLQWV